MKEKLTIIKVSGKIIEEPEALKLFIRELTTLKGKRLLIHSGSNLASMLADKMRVRISEIDGKPVVNDNTLNVLTMVYAGKVNKQLVALLQARKINALGVTGADLNLITSVKRKIARADLGYTGEVRSVNSAMLSMLVDAGAVPVIAPLTHDGRGSLLFNETDAMAAEVAKALALRYDITLIYCFEKNGISVTPGQPDNIVPELKRSVFKELRDMKFFNEWVANKLDNAFSAIDHGVKEVIVTSASQLAHLEKGTHIK